MNWTDRNSLVLTKVCLHIILVLTLAVLIYPDPLLDVIFLSLQDDLSRNFVMLSLRAYALVGIGVWVELNALLKNLDAKVVFNEKNIVHLRRLSWMCVGGFLVGLVSTLYFKPWIVIATVFGFIALIVRVVKNVFCQAQILQEESDYTI